MNRFAYNIASQNGEDGVLDEIYRRLEERLGSLRGTYAFECGAWDGKHLSNTWLLTKTRDVKVIAVERDPQRFGDLRSTAEENPNIVPVHAELSPTEDSIGKILDARVPQGSTISLLSIDIDGLDYDVWKMYRPPPDRAPMIAVIEVDSGIPPWKASEDRARGASLMEMRALGAEKGYVLVAHTGNAIFVREDLARHVVRAPPSLVEAFRPLWLSSEDRRAFSALAYSAE